MIVVKIINCLQKNAGFNCFLHKRIKNLNLHIAIEDKKYGTASKINERSGWIV